MTFPCVVKSFERFASKTFLFLPLFSGSSCRWLFASCFLPLKKVANRLCRIFFLWLLETLEQIVRLGRRLYFTESILFLFLQSGICLLDQGCQSFIFVSDCQFFNIRHKGIYQLKENPTWCFSIFLNQNHFLNNCLVAYCLENQRGYLRHLSVQALFNYSNFNFRCDDYSVSYEWHFQPG